MLGEAFFAIRAIQQSGVVWSVGGTNADIFFASHTVFGAVFILAAKVFQVVHDSFSEIKSLVFTNVRETEQD